jgi:hypothetical protein
MKLTDVPKCPENKASFQDVISGTNLYRSSKGGMRRSTRIAIINTNNRHGASPNSGELYELKGNQAPM